MRTRACLTALLVSSVAALHAAAPADAAGTFFGRIPFASTQAQDGERPIAAVGADGTLYLAYRDGSGSTSVPGRVDIRTLGPQGTFSADQQPVQPASANQFPQGLALGPGGIASVLWSDNETSNLLLRRFSAAGVLNPTTIQLNATGQGIAGGTLANRPSGASVAVWRNNSLNRVAFREVSAAGVAGPERLLGLTGQNPDFSQEIAIAPNGDAIVVWGDGSASRRIFLRTVSAAGVVGPLETVAAGQLFDVHVGVDASGRAIVTWSDTSSSSVKLRVRQSSGAYGPIETVKATGASGAELGVSSAGDAAVVWLEGANVVAGRRRTAAGAYGPLTTLRSAEPSVGVQNPRVSMESGGTAVVIWERLTAGSDTVVGRGFRPDSSADALTTLSDNSSAILGRSTIANDGVGDVVVAAPNGLTHKFNVQTGDFGGPEQRGLTAPGKVERGVSASFSFTPFDRRSAIGPSRWVFSDGTVVQSSRATHAFKTAGSFTARAVSTDGVGNVRDTATTVRVVDTRKPAITRLSLSRSVFRLGARPVAVTAKKKKKRKRSTRLRYRLSEDARVTIAVQRRTIGRRKGKSCRRATRKNRKAKHCVRYVKVKLAAVKRDQRAGRRNTLFSGRVGKRKLAAGRYRFVLQARDPSGNVSSKRTKAFRIAR